MTPKTTASAAAEIAREDVVRIALEAAKETYPKPGELDDYDVIATLKDDGWHVDFRFKDKGMWGGGPHFVMDRTGRILKRWNEQ